MTRSSDYLPSRKGVGRKLIRKVILLSVLIVGILFISSLMKHPDNSSKTTIQDVETRIVEDYVSSLKEEGYEDIFYELDPLIKFMEENHIPRQHPISMSLDLEQIIIDRYWYYTLYYSVSIGDSKLLFKHEDDCKNFLEAISKYDSKKYSINRVKELVHKESTQDVLNDLISSKKKAYEAAQAKKRAEASRRQSTNTNHSLSSYQSYARDLVLNTYGWSEYDFECLVRLWNRESGWNPNSHNKSTGAHGIPQALPASKMASEGSDYYTNGYTQIRWGLKYIKGRYGSPSKAWSSFQSKGWY